MLSVAAVFPGFGVAVAKSYDEYVQPTQRSVGERCIAVVLVAIARHGRLCGLSGAGSHGADVCQTRRYGSVYGNTDRNTAHIDVVSAQHRHGGDGEIAGNDAGVTGVDNPSRRKQIDIAGFDTDTGS